jgi:hypothetical protein
VAWITSGAGVVRLNLLEVLPGRSSPHSLNIKINALAELYPASKATLSIFVPCANSRMLWINRKLP